MAILIRMSINQSGEAAIPPEVRCALGVPEGGAVEFIIEEDGAVRVQPAKYPTIASLRGALGYLKKPLTSREMKELAHAARVQEYFDGR